MPNWELVLFAIVWKSKLIHDAKGGLTCNHLVCDHLVFAVNFVKQFYNDCSVKV